MPIIGTGGVKISGVKFSNRFKRDRKKLELDMIRRLDEKIRDLMAEIMPPGLRFEKLGGYHNPDIYTIHITGNYKVSMTIDGEIATLRRVGCHDEIDRLP